MKDGPTIVRLLSLEAYKAIEARRENLTETRSAILDRVLRSLDGPGTISLDADVVAALEARRQSPEETLPAILRRALLGIGAA